MRYAGGGEYRGAFCRDARHGAGELRDAAGATLYAGAWENDVRAGQGEGLTSSADHWRGRWVGGEPDGEGTLTYAAEGGGVYEGQYAGGRRQGHGRLSLPTGEEYEGEWQADRRHGEGRSRTAGGDEYVGG